MIKLSLKDIIISLILVFIVGIIIVWLFISVSGTAAEPTMGESSVGTTAPTFIEESIPPVSTTPTEIETTIPTEFKVEDILFDNTLQYYVFDNEAILIAEIEKYHTYIDKLAEEILNYPEDADKIKEEIDRAISIIEQYNYDLKFINKGIFAIPESYRVKDFKSYEDYRAITSKNTPHYKLQHEYAVTGPEGIRMVDNRYCIAIGSYFTTTIGQYIDIVLENGTVIPCILGDQKSDAHTDDLHIAHKSDGSIVEFIVDLEVLDSIPRQMGNVSYVYPEWKSPVVQIIVYEINFLRC